LTSSLFGTPFSNERLTPVGTPDKNALPMLRFIRVDEDFVRTAGLTIVKGRDFDAGPGRKSAYLVSESTAAVLGLDEPLGVECLSDVHDGQAPIVGVFRDFHFASLHSPVELLVLEYQPDGAGYLLVRSRADRVPEVLEFLKIKALELSPNFLFTYRFADEVFEANYGTEERSYDLFKVFSAVALFVACLGLFGLAVYAAESRVKEIGILPPLGGPGQRDRPSRGLSGHEEMAPELRLPHGSPGMDVHPRGIGGPLFRPGHGRLPGLEVRAGESGREPAIRVTAIDRTGIPVVR
jgi:putative ABC transport system permease protein